MKTVLYRRAVPAAALAVAVLSLAACGTSGGSGGTSGTPAGVKDAGDQKYVMVTFLSGIEFWKPARRGLEDAAKQLGVQASYQGTPNYSAPEEIAVLEQVAATNPAGILVTAQNADALKEPIKKIIAGGTDVVMIDSDSPDSGRQTIVEVDNLRGGAVAADEMAKRVNGTGEVGIINAPGQYNIEQRVAGFEAQLKAKYPKMKIVEEADALGDYNKSATAAAGFLQSHPNLVGIFSAGSEGGPGAVQALKEAGKLDQVTVIGFDIDDAATAAIQKGDMEATVVQDAYCMGYWGLQQVFAAHNDLVKPVDNPEEVGAPVLPAATKCGVYPVTKDNVAALK